MLLRVLLNYFRVYPVLGCSHNSSGALVDCLVVICAFSASVLSVLVIKFFFFFVLLRGSRIPNRVGGHIESYKLVVDGVVLAREFDVPQLFS